MPAAAVIPAPIAYTNAVAVKKLVVGFRVEGCKVAPPSGYRGRFRRSAVFREVVETTPCIRPSLCIHGFVGRWKPP